MDPGSIPGGCVLQPGGGTQRLRFPEGASCSPGVAHSGLDSRRVRLAARGWHTAGLNACVLCVFLCQYLAVMLATFACFYTFPLITSRWLSFIARVVLSVRRSRTIGSTLVSEVFCGLAHHVGKRWLSFIARAVLSLGRNRANAKHTGFRGFLWVGSSCWEEVTLFHCKNCAFIRSKRCYCQTHWFQRFFVGWLIMLGRGGPLSLQELCFQ